MKTVGRFLAERRKRPMVAMRMEITHFYDPRAIGDFSDVIR